MKGYSPLRTPFESDKAKNKKIEEDSKLVYIRYPIGDWFKQLTTYLLVNIIQ